VQAHIPWLSTRALASVEASDHRQQKDGNRKINDARFLIATSLAGAAHSSLAGIGGNNWLHGRIGRQIRNLRPSSRPASIDHFFETPAEHENDEDENNADHHDLPLRNRASGTHARGHPNAGRGREPLHVMTFLASDNDTRAQKTDARHDALDHTTGVGARHCVDRQNGQSRAEAQDAKRAHAGRLPMQIAVKPEHGANYAGCAEPKRNVESIHDLSYVALGQKPTTTARKTHFPDSQFRQRFFFARRAVQRACRARAGSAQPVAQESALEPSRRPHPSTWAMPRWEGTALPVAASAGAGEGLAARSLNRLAEVPNGAKPPLRVLPLVDNACPKVSRKRWGR
jgi:hypothetical protein